jgi:dTDP-4-amino-4,6-dideoxygalactose transaminase
MAPISFNRARALGREFEYIQAAIDSMHLSGDGQFTRKCSELLEKALGAPKVLLTTSCTHALEMAALLVDLKPDDEVIVPSFTFVSTAAAFRLHGARIVFADVRRDTLNLDESKLEALITPRTRAIVPVHYAGVGCEMEAMTALARRHAIAVIEDNAHGLFGRYRGRPLGTLGQLGVQSFHETKNFTSGEGGALVINDPALIDRAEVIRQKGTNRSRFFRGQVDKYTWVDDGSSYLPSEILAAFLYAQLEQRETVQARRKKIWDCYAANLHDWAAAHEVSLPLVPAHCEQAYHMFYLLMPSLEHRQRMIRHLADREVNAVFHYVPLHLSTMGLKLGGRPGMCPVTESTSDRLLRLPFHNSLSEEDQARVVEAVRAYPFR